MGTNYTKENIPEMNINSIHSDINSNMNERISVINDFIHSNSFSKNESISPLKIKKSNLNKNCNIENILKISENIFKKTMFLQMNHYIYHYFYIKI